MWLRVVVSSGESGDQWTHLSSDWKTQQAIKSGTIFTFKWPVGCSSVLQMKKEQKKRSEAIAVQVK